MLKQSFLALTKKYNANLELANRLWIEIETNPLRSDNEEKSAGLAVERLGLLSLDEIQISKCNSQILATKSHMISNDNDTNLFTDADLSILGQDWNAYLQYAANIRKEYGMYTDSVYNAGRTKVLKHFLEMEGSLKHHISFANMKSRQGAI
jgi:predicted metal-dependent HD superfamily phosphohydrolase